MLEVEKIKNIVRPSYYGIKNFICLPLGFYKYYKVNKFTEVQKKIAKKFKFFKKKRTNEKDQGVLLVQMVKNYEYTIKLAAASKAIAEKRNLEVNFYEVDINWIWKPTSWAWKTEKFKVLYDVFFTGSLEKIHLSFGGKVIFRTSEKYRDQKFIKRELNKILDNLKDEKAESILSLRFEDVLVGDLIYDTYLRYFFQPTVERIDRNVAHTIEVALNVFYNFKLFLKRHNVRYLLNSYSSYIQHGIPARICLHNDIGVSTVGSNDYLIQELYKDFPFHINNHTLFDKERRLSIEQLELAKQRLTSRFKGQIDSATSYMKVSTYTNTVMSDELRERFSERPRNIVIYAHDFYDSPHTDRLLQFPDLYQYLKQTLNELTDLTDTTVFVKIHPNGLKGCKEMTIDLVGNLKKKHIQILDESISNLNIVELKPDLICTARGTIGIEMAHFEIPTVALYDNIYNNFNFVHTCMDKTSYFSILRDKEKPVIDFNKEKIYSFYYQAYIEKAVLEADNAFLLLHSYKENTYCDEYLKFILSKLDKVFSEKFIGYYSDAFNQIQLNNERISFK